MTKLDAPPSANIAATGKTHIHRKSGQTSLETVSFAEQLDALTRTKGITGSHNVTQLLALVAGETNFKQHAHNKTTGATGPFQFVKATWLQLVKEHGESLGVDKSLVDQITDNGKGRPAIGDPATLKTVLALRNDVALATRMAVRYLDDNRTALTHQLRRAPSEPELQASFLLGASGAAKLIKAAAQTPEIKAADLVPHAASANHRLFYDKSGEARSAAETVAFLAEKYRSDKAKTAAYLASAAMGSKHQLEA